MAEKSIEGGRAYYRALEMANAILVQVLPRDKDGEVLSEKIFIIHKHQRILW